MSAESTVEDHPLVQALRRIDPLLVFLTRATGEVQVGLPVLRRTLPPAWDASVMLADIQALVSRGILSASVDANWDWSSSSCQIGFASPETRVADRGNLHGSTKAAAKRRLAALKRLLQFGTDDAVNDKSSEPAKLWEVTVDQSAPVNEDEPVVEEEERTAQQALAKLLQLEFGASMHATDRDTLPVNILPRQVSYAGSHPAQASVYEDLPEQVLAQIPLALQRAFGTARGSIQPRRLYRHQARAIQSALEGQHTTVCTGTGSGKSACFLLPVLTAAYQSNATSLILFPTKALAQDQLSKLQSLLASHTDLVERIRPATLDGDTPHSTRTFVAESANVILTNPDTLHAALLPAWRTMYASLLGRLQYVVVDESHMYEGVFGAHVAMILSRLARVAAVAGHELSGQPRLPTFLAASATLPWPEQHFRLLFPIPSSTPVKVLATQDDGSPRAAKHFFVWNPPILHTDGTSTGQVTGRCVGQQPVAALKGKKRKHSSRQHTAAAPISPEELIEAPLGREPLTHRRHAADETALLLAKAVIAGVRCIAFCKTRNLVEWVYERCLAALNRDSSTAHLVAKVESYRGGYSMMERRKIEERLFRDELIGVVGTNALELGVDIGGIDLTLHCGYPSTYASLLQQAGRSGRGADRLETPSCAVVVCFNSPSEQHFWRHPASLLAKGVLSPHSIPINGGLVQSHLLCASEEFPSTVDRPVTCLLDGEGTSALLSDEDLFGGQDVYKEASEALASSRSVVEERVTAPSGCSVPVYKAHASMHKSWSRVSIRSIEPVNYSVVNLAHPGQANRTDGIHDQQAVLDTLPYSRVFYHAHPGAIITHRGTKFKVVSMTRPPAFAPENFGYRSSLSLAAFARPTNARYATRPLSNLHITVIKQLGRVDIDVSKSDGDEAGKQDIVNKQDMNDAVCSGALAGYGAVSVKRTVHGYKKLSLITRAEIARSELTLPPLEFDTFGVWIDTELDTLHPMLGDKYGYGVHALCHALLAVAPVFVPGLVRADLECDHAFFAPRRVMLFDERAGGSGACERLWKLFFQPNSILDAAIELLDDCSSCSGDSGYDGGCPACIHASNCIKFNMHLSRSAGAVIGKRMLQRIQQTKLYRQRTNKNAEDKAVSSENTPRRKARETALRDAKEMRPARERQFVVGRPSWPLDGDERSYQQVHAD